MDGMVGRSSNSKTLLFALIAMFVLSSGTAVQAKGPVVGLPIGGVSVSGGTGGVSVSGGTGGVSVSGGTGGVGISGGLSGILSTAAI